MNVEETIRVEVDQCTLKLLEELIGEFYPIGKGEKLKLSYSLPGTI